MRSEKYKITVVTVVKNGVETIEKTITSVLRQKTADIEYIIVDGASTDGTLEVVEKYKEDVSMLISETDKGIYEAMNKGIMASNGEFIAFMNSGDQYVDGALLKILAYKKENIDVLVGKAIKMVEGVSFGTFLNYRTEDLWRLKTNNIFCHQAMFIRKSLFEEIGLYNTRYKWLADYAWNLEAYTDGRNIELIDENIALYDLSGVSHYSDISEEYREIAYKYMREDVELKPLIDRTYLQRKHMYELVSGFDEKKYLNDKFVIYGAGIYGLRVFELFKSHKIEILAFFDKEKFGKQLMGIDIFCPDKANLTKLLSDTNIKVCVAVLGRESEIVEYLVREGVLSEQIITLQEL